MKKTDSYPVRLRRSILSTFAKDKLFEMYCRHCLGRNQNPPVKAFRKDWLINQILAI